VRGARAKAERRAGVRQSASRDREPTELVVAPCRSCGRTKPLQRKTRTCADNRCVAKRALLELRRMEREEAQ